MNDRIFLKGLLVHAHHGLLSHESEVGQRFVIDLDMEIDLGRAAASDHLADTVSYADVAEVTLSTFKARNFKLLEAAAGAVAEAILSAFPAIAAITVTVHKPHAPSPPSSAMSGVTMTRRRAA